MVLEDAMQGILAAKRAGMYAIGYRNPSSGKQDFTLADCIVEKIAEIDVKELFNAG